MHPAIYVFLVHTITEETNWTLIKGSLKQSKLVECTSIPVISQNKQSNKATQIENWLEKIEKRTMTLSLEYDYLYQTDLVDCYGSIYTHSLDWALHGKPLSKKRRGDCSLVGNAIDRLLQSMSNGQTNGIPQGSVLSDLLSEIVLSYTDRLITEELLKIKLKDFQILRYRDDYKIFVNNPETAETIIKIISEFMMSLGLKVNDAKTSSSDNILLAALKPDKLHWIVKKSSSKNLLEQIQILHVLAEKYPHSGSLEKELREYFKLLDSGCNIYSSETIVSYIIDIISKNPRTYPVGSGILSRLLSNFNLSTKKKIWAKVKKKLSKVPNTAYLDIWLQRITLKFDKKTNPSDLICQKVLGEDVHIWNSDWLKGKLEMIMKTTPIIDLDILENLDEVMTSKEIELFRPPYE